MYMHAPHNHVHWKERKTDMNTSWKERQKNQDAAKHKATDFKPDPKEKGGKISFSKRFKTALATQVVFSDAEANHLVNKVINSAFDDASNDGASKY